MAKRGALQFMGLDSMIGQGKGMLSAFANTRDMAVKSTMAVVSAISRDRAISRSGNHASLMASLKRLNIKTNDALGKTANRIIENCYGNIIAEVKRAGGTDRVGRGTYAAHIDKARAQLLRAVEKLGGVSQNIVAENAKALEELSGAIQRKGLAGAASKIKKLESRAFSSNVSSSLANEGMRLQEKIYGVLTGKTRLSGKLQGGLRRAHIQLGEELRAAKTDPERVKAMENAANNMISLAAHAKDPNAKKAIGALVADATSRATSATAFVKDKNSQRVAMKMSNTMQVLAKGLGHATSAIGVAKLAIERGIAVWQSVNRVVNAFGRQQMAIQSERGNYGRMIRGAGINPHDLMTAIHAGRQAGMDDATVINQQVSLQQQLAKARWGEGDLIAAVGRWGGTPYNADGSVKSQHEMMSEFSRILNSLGSDLEKLQFIGDIGYRPEQMEMLANYNKEAARANRIKGNALLQGTLEKANILDESGYYARADAATKIELRRREILNQNAIDEGGIAYFKRALSPDNWFFSDYTARQQGVASAKSEDAMKALTRELQNRASAVRAGGGTIDKGSLLGAGNETGLSGEQLQALGLSSGWAKAVDKNLGKNSPISILKNVVGDWSEDDAKRARAAARGSEADWAAWQKSTGMTNLTRAQALTMNFDKNALEGAKVQQLIAKAMELTGGKEVDITQLGGDKYLKTMTEGLAPGSAQYEQRIIEALARTADETIGRDEAILEVLKKGINVADPIVADRISELTKQNKDKGMGEASARSAAQEQAINEVYNDAGKNGDLLKAQLAKREQEAREGYSRYQRQVRYGQLAPMLSREEWERQNGYGSTQEEREKQAYRDLRGMGIGELPFEKLTDSLKQERVKASLVGKNVLGSNTKGYSNEIAGLDDDALVAWLAMENDTSEDEIRSNILSKEAYQKLKDRQAAGEQLWGDDAAKLRIYESSTAFKGSEATKAATVEQENKSKQEAMNDYATYKAAMELVPGAKTAGRGLVTNLNRAYSQAGLTYDDLKKAETTGKDIGTVDRKKLMRIASASGVDLSKHFSAEEIAAYQKDLAQEKENFLAGGGSEGQYKLFQELSNRELTGHHDKISEKERKFLEEGKKKAAQKAKSPKRVLAKEESLSSQFADLKAQGDAFKSSWGKSEKKEGAKKAEAKKSTVPRVLKRKKKKKGKGKDGEGSAAPGANGETPASISEIAQAAGKEAPSALEAAKDNAAQAEKAAASGSAAKSKEKTGAGGEAGGNTINIGSVTNNWNNMDGVQGTPERIEDAAEKGTEKGICKAFVAVTDNSNGM